MAMTRRTFAPRPASQVTDEGAWQARHGLDADATASPSPLLLRRRDLLRVGLALPALALAGCRERPYGAVAPLPTGVDSPGGLRTTEEATRYADASTYNNYYEFGTAKDEPARNAQGLRTRPWSVEVAGHAARTGAFALEDLLRLAMPEERIYRMRCVEGWSMVIPWLGLPLAKVLAHFQPTAQAKFVAFTSLADPAQMPGLRYPTLDWPYREGLRIDEAMHPLALLATGMYGKALPNQNGAPLRLVVPWKYGFKGIKAIVRIEFTEAMPATAWNVAAPDEYGFYANVNPAVDHPRWSQASERRIAGSASKLFAERIPTRPFNGYAEQVASLYAGMDLARWF
jgi:sulfoxide reductase catalytic subunit YedY